MLMVFLVEFRDVPYLKFITFHYQSLPKCLMFNMQEEMNDHSQQNVLLHTGWKFGHGKDSYYFLLFCHFMPSYVMHFTLKGSKRK